MERLGGNMLQCFAMKRTRPILVGVGQFCPREFEPAAATAPVELATRAARIALADSGAAAALRARIDTLAFVRLLADSAAMNPPPFGGSSCPPRSVTQRLNIDPSRCIYSIAGGHVPQALMSELGEAVASGACRAALIVGAEAIRTTTEALRRGLTLDWREEPAGSCEDRGFGPQLFSAHEFAHGVGMPMETYPLFEHGLRGALGRSVPQHVAVLGRLFARFAAVATANPLAAFPRAWSAEELATPSPSNRWTGHPYTLWMNAHDRVDMGAAALLTSPQVARECGIAEDRWIHLIGCGDATDHRHVLERVDYCSSPALRLAASRALGMAATRIEAIESFDLYSCFPSPVELACREFGIPEDDPRELTLTGGLPFFGGPGSNYSLHAIAEMVSHLRRLPGALGLVSANGGYLTKESVGIYSSTPAPGEWRYEGGGANDRAIAAMPAPRVCERPQGPASIETYTVVHERGTPAKGIVIGRLHESGERFVALTPRERPDILTWLVEGEPLGARGAVRRPDGSRLNEFVPQLTV